MILPNSLRVVSRCRQRVRRAMTLMEILVVVVILGLAGALVVPSMGTTGVLRVQGAVRTIVSDLTLAQSDAMAMQQGRAIVFDVASNSYRLVAVVGGAVDLANTIYDPSRGGKQYIVNLNDSEFAGATITSAVFADTGATLILDDMGTPVTSASSNTPSTGGIITVTGSGTTHQIIVEPYTGRITVRRTSAD